ncbi:MAG: hypothetical protein NCW75_01340 [Phycisphaera sp.]|nr:MAG: hypothetical protein NCW75_01340 [Phycisphaera sp.]
MGPSAEAATTLPDASGGATMSGTASVRQVLLFAGAIRPTPLLKAAARNVLDLPLLDEQTIGQRWIAAHQELCQSIGSAPPLRVLIDRKNPKPTSMPEGQATIEPDDVAFLGTGGVLRAAAKDQDGMMLVATGGSVLTRTLPEVVARLLALEADVALLAEHDGTPTGVMLVSAAVMREIPGAGYIDFKEQCLPGIAERHRVRVARAARGERVCLPIRNREQYLEALAYQADGEPFQVVEDGAEVSPAGRVRDAVVLAGARIGAKSVVARSFLGPGAVVPAGQVLTDRTLGAGA